jgi:hypothetical protein
MKNDEGRELEPANSAELVSSEATLGDDSRLFLRPKAATVVTPLTSCILKL